MISPANGAAQRVGTIGPREFHALVFDQSGRLFASAADAAGSDRFLELDPATGAVVGDIGPIGAKDVFGLAFDKDGMLWATAVRGGTEGQLFTIDAATGLGTPVVNIDRALFSLAIEPPKAASLAGIVVADPGAGAFGRGLLFRIDPTTGNRIVITDLNDSAQGPIGADPGAVAVEGGGNLLVADNSSGAGFRGTLFRMSPATGIRTVLSDFANAAQGSLGTDPMGVAIESTGTILVADPGGAQGDPNLLFRVDPATGMRTILSDFTDPGQGPTGENPSGLALDYAGRILVATGQTGTGLRGVLFRVDPATGTRELLSDFGDANQGPRGDLPYGVALEPGGTILVTTTFKVDGIGTSFNGMLFRVDPSDGTRTILSAFGDPAQGPVGFSPSGVAIEPSGSILVAAQHVGTFDSPGGIFRIDPVTGERTLLSDFGNASQGPLGVNPTGVAIIVAPSP
jgi:DNA-binding beta-propeller fold protein YncE